MDRDKHGWYCRNETACFNRIYAQLSRCRRMIAKYREVGAQMANLYFNLSQQNGHVLTPEVTTAMRKLCQRWDVANFVEAQR